jgi:MipA family protein
MALTRRQISITAKWRPCATAQMLLLIALPTMAQEQSPPSEYGWSGHLGVGAATAPTYEGSPNRRGNAIPMLALTYRDPKLGTFDLGQRGLAWIFIEKPLFQLGVALGADAGRKAGKVNRSALIPEQGDERLAGMGDIKAAAEYGVLASAGPLAVFAHRAIGDRGHGGTQIDMNISCPIPITKALGLRIGGGLTWADRRYMQAYFGVTAAQAAASRFAAFTPEAGLRAANVSLGAEYKLSETWRVQAQASGSRLLGDAKNSPIAEKDTSLWASLGIAYHF